MCVTSDFVSDVSEKLFHLALRKLALSTYWLKGDNLEKSAKSNYS